MGRKVVEMKAAQPRGGGGGAGGILLEKAFKFRVSEMPSSVFCRTLIFSKLIRRKMQ